MACEEQQSAFKQGLLDVSAKLNDELAGIAADTESQANQIEQDFHADNDLAAGVGAAAGTVVGGIVAGTPGAAIGGVLGKQIGSLFTLEVQMYRHEVILSVPQTTMKTSHISFDLPTVTVRNEDIVISLPSLVMKRVPGPRIPRTVVGTRRECLGPICSDVPDVRIEWDESWLDVPEYVPSDVRIVVGIPEVTMQRQEFSFDTPEIRMEDTKFSVDVPTVTLRFIKDAGRRTAAMAAALMQSTQEAATRKQMEFRDRLKVEVVPLAHAMFGCFRADLSKRRTDVQALYQPQIDTLIASVATMAGQQVPETDTQMIGARAALTAAINNRDTALKSFDEALSKMDEAEQKAIDGFMGQSNAALGTQVFGLRPRSLLSSAITFAPPA